jgi:hypothetical protein
MSMMAGDAIIRLMVVSAIVIIRQTILPPNKASRRTFALRAAQSTPNSTNIIVIIAAHAADANRWADAPPEVVMEIDDNNIELLVSGIGSLVADKNGVWVKNGDDAICVLWEDVVAAQQSVQADLACTCGSKSFYNKNDARYCVRCDAIQPNR